MDMIEANENAPLLERQTSRLLGQVASLMARRTGEALGRLGATRNEFAVLATLDAFGADSQAGLSRRTRIDRSDMVAALSGLESMGAVARTVDANDRRRNVVALTEAGRARLADLAAALETAQVEALGPLNAQEVATLRGLLLRLRAHYQNGPS